MLLQNIVTIQVASMEAKAQFFTYSQRKPDFMIQEAFIQEILDYTEVLSIA